MNSRTVRPGAKDEKKTAKGLPSFDTQLPVSNTLCTEGSTIHSFHISDFGTFDQSVGFCLENAVNLSGNTVFNSAKQVAYQFLPITTTLALWIRNRPHLHKSVCQPS